MRRNYASSYIAPVSIEYEFQMDGLLMGPKSHVFITIDEDLAYFWLLVGGADYAHKEGIIFTTDKDEILAEFVKRVQELFFGSVSCKLVNLRLYIMCPLFREFLHSAGFGYEDAITKKCPWTILQSSREVQLAFIKGMTRMKNSKELSVTNQKDDIIATYTYSKTLGKDIQIILLSMGILCKRTATRIKGIKIWKLAMDLDGVTCEPSNFVDFVTSTKTKTKTVDLYDFEVPSSHTFISNGFVSHNCQGSTLDYVVCDLGSSVFCAGQAYVALVEFDRLNGLHLSAFNPKSIMVDKKACAYVSSLEDDQLSERVHDIHIDDSSSDSD